MMCDMHDCVNKLNVSERARIQGQLYKRSRKQQYPGQKKRLKAIIVNLVILSNYMKNTLLCKIFPKSYQQIIRNQPVVCLFCSAEPYILSSIVFIAFVLFKKLVLNFERANEILRRISSALQYLSGPKKSPVQ